MNAISEMCGRFIAEDIFERRMDDRDHAIAVFKAHAKAVQDTIAAERLVVYETGSGWGPLCAFLDVPEPDEPYPMTNSSKEFRERHGGGN